MLRKLRVTDLKATDYSLKFRKQFEEVMKNNEEKEVKPLANMHVHVRDRQGKGHAYTRTFVLANQAKMACPLTESDQPICYRRGRPWSSTGV
mgnify:CR=1 FL=1